ncbi:hypothetical protein [Actinomadura chokoriensis]|uniref:Pyridoxamine 5'-phosphate oxidase putative domain-containing protein n=1 Tax=Actinomadura chokoriensis TaxID=454156 RepID=A0ABV4R3D1_9ACTN
MAGSGDRRVGRAFDARADMPMAFSSEVLPAAVQAIASSPSRQRPVVMVTCGADGQPRVCVPDWGELRVVGDQRLRVAVWPSDPTAVNLDRDPSALLIVPALADVYLIHATARRLVDAAMVWAHYELTITSARVADRGTTPHLQSESDADGEVEFLTQRLPKSEDTLGRASAALKARRRNSPQRSPWAPSPDSEEKGDQRCAEGA